MAHVAHQGQGAPGIGGGRENMPKVKQDKFPPPEISDPATDTDWEYFVSSWLGMDFF